MEERMRDLSEDDNNHKYLISSSIFMVRRHCLRNFYAKKAIDRVLSWMYFYLIKYTINNMKEPSSNGATGPLNEGSPIETPSLSLDELNKMTDNFGLESLIGEGSYCFFIQIHSSQSRFYTSNHDFLQQMLVTVSFCMIVLLQFVHWYVSSSILFMHTMFLFSRSCMQCFFCTFYVHFNLILCSCS